MRCRSTKLSAPRRVLGNHRTSPLPRERAAGPHPTTPIPAPGADITLFLGVQYRFTSQGDSIAMVHRGFPLPCATSIVMRIPRSREEGVSLGKYFHCNAASSFCEILKIEFSLSLCLSFSLSFTVLSFLINVILISSYYTCLL